MNKKKTGHLPLYIYNPIEDEWGYISTFPKNEQKKLIHNSNRFADSYLFSNSFFPFFYFLSPIPVGRAFKTYFEQLSNVRCRILTPASPTPFIALNCFKDKKVFSCIVSEAKKAGGLTLFAYTISKELYQLKKKLEEKGISVSLPEGPAERNAWTVSHFGSKSGFRNSFAPLMPKGIVTDNFRQAIDAAMGLFRSSSGVVIKTDKGNAGQGVMIYKKNNMTPNQLREKLEKLFDKEQYFKNNPIIVEQFIDTSKEKRSPFPSIEYVVHQSGVIEMQYYCNMIVTPEGEFYGMEMHKGVFSKPILSQVLSISKKVARKYRDSGFCGRFDVDMLCDGKKVYANESNIRTTGGTDTYYIIKKLIGEDFFTKRYVLSCYMDLPKHIPATFSAVEQMSKPFLYQERTKTGVVINSESVIKNKGVSYVVIGKDKKETTNMHEAFKQKLTNHKKG